MNEDTREQVRQAFERRLARPVRWAGSETTLGDFDGRDSTLEVFGVEPGRQFELRRELRPLRRVFEELLRRPITLVFHTPEAVREHYQEVVLSQRIMGSGSDLRPRAVAGSVQLLDPIATKSAAMAVVSELDRLVLSMQTTWVSGAASTSPGTRLDSLAMLRMEGALPFDVTAMAVSSGPIPTLEVHTP